MRWMMYRWWCEGGGDRAWWVIESVFLRSPDKGFWACLGDIPPDMPRRPETRVSLYNLILMLMLTIFLIFYSDVAPMDPVYMCTFTFLYSSDIIPCAHSLRWSITPYIVWVILWQINRSCHKMVHKCFLNWGDWLSCDLHLGSHDSQSPHMRT